MSEEEDDDYDDNEDNGSDNEGYEDIYDNIFFPEEPSEDQKKRTLTFSPQQTAEDGIFSYENKVTRKLLLHIAICIFLRQKKRHKDHTFHIAASLKKKKKFSNSCFSESDF